MYIIILKSINSFLFSFHWMYLFPYFLDSGLLLWNKGLRKVLKDFKTKRNITNNNKLRSFQYPILQSAVVTNKKLTQYKIRTDPLTLFVI